MGSESQSVARVAVQSSVPASRLATVGKERTVTTDLADNPQAELKDTPRTLTPLSFTSVPALGPSELKVGSVDDPLEHEADRIAEQVMRFPALQTKPQVSNRAHGRETDHADTAPASVHQALTSPGEPLVRPLRREMEERFGYDFSKVRVHRDALAQQSACEVGALAYTVGHHVVFAANEFAPATPGGLRTLAHELTHVVQQSIAGARGAMLRRQPHPNQQHSLPKPRDPIAELQKILSSSAPLSGLRTWLDAHPTELPVAKQVLLDKATTATAEKEWRNLGDLLGEVFARDPSPQDARDALMRQVDTNAPQVWEQYIKGALLAAIQQWTADPNERQRILAKATTAPEKAARTKQLASLRAEADGALKDLRKARGPLMQNLQRSLAALPLQQSGTFVPKAEQDLVTRHLRDFEHAIAFAQGFRADTYELYTRPNPERDVAVEIASLDRQRDAAEAGIKAAQQKLDEARQLMGTGAAVKVHAATVAFEKAQARKQAAATARTKASAAAVRTIKYREDPREKQTVDTALTKETAQVRGLVEKRAQASNLTSSLGLIDDDASWWIIWHYAITVRDGFEGFPMEHVLLPLLMARNRMITAPKGTGIDAGTTVDTYAGHGWGQYDLNAPAGKNIDVVEPREIDLSPVFGGQKAVFEWIGSSVETTFGHDPRQPEKDVLDKLAYGFFGRDRQFEQKIEQTDVATSGLPKGRSPEPNRLVAGLLFRGTVAGAPLEIEDQLVELRNELEQLLEDSPEFEGLRVDESQDILRQTFDASGGGTRSDFGTADLLNPEAFGGRIQGTALRAFNSAVTRILNDPENSFTGEVFALLQSRLAVLKASGGVETGHKGVLDWAGPNVSILHHYRRKGGTDEAWIRVIYLHLHEAAAATKESRQPLAVGKVGSAGAAVNPHVHMAIAVFRTKPSWNTQPIDYIDPTDFYGMVPRSPFNPVLP